jgi:hypothetical protein
MGAIDRLHTWATAQPVLRVFTVTVRVLLALAFVPSGLVKIMGEPFTTLPISDPVGYFFCRLFLGSWLLPVCRRGSMGGQRPTPHPSHCDNRRSLVLPHYREHLRDHDRDWTGILRYASGHWRNDDRERIPSVLGLGSLEARPSARNTVKGTSRRPDYDSRTGDRRGCRVPGYNRSSPRSAA